jgi:hypothetical protein
MTKKALFFVLACTFSIYAKAQCPCEDSLQLKKGWILAADLVNFIDNYSAFLVSAERVLSNDFGIVLEAGPVLVPENYYEPNFSSYFGFKSRAEFRLYYRQNPEKKLRDFLSVDVGYHKDWYEMQYDISFGEFSRIEKGIFHRRLIDYHLRWGRQRFLLSTRKLVLEWSIGVGLQNLFYREPDTNGAFIFTQSDITDFNDIEPISFNARIKIGYLLGK